MFCVFINNLTMNFIAFICLFFILLKFSYSTLSEQCTKSTSFWESMKYPYIISLQNIKQQSDPIKCQTPTSTCCNPELLKDMWGVSELNLNGLSVKQLESVLTMLSNDSYVLMNMFLTDLENTKNDLNQLFSATYGYNYKVHKLFFYSWFDKLKLYMEGKLHNISQLLDDFFLEMAEKIVKILIPPESGPEVTKCHTQQLIEAKPYQETDIALKTKIVKSYPPARLLVNAIAVGRDAFKQLLKKAPPSQNCLEKFNTGFHCMICNGLTIKSCPATCKAVLENCIGSFKSSDLKKVDRVLNKYAKSIISLAAKLDNPFNFPLVNHKMNVQISTAIMSVQNTYPSVKEQIKAKCQKGGGLSRRKRQASKEFITWQNANKNSEKPWWEKNLDETMNGNEEKKNVLTSHSRKPNDFLSPTAKSIKRKYKALEIFFQKNIRNFCSANSAALDSPQCWNGTAAIKPVAVSEKNSKKKNEKVIDSTVKTAVNNLHEISVRINDFISGKTADPETLVVEEFKFHSPKVEKKPADKLKKTSKVPSLEGSGDAEKFPPNEPILPPKVNVKPVEPTQPPILEREPIKPELPNKPDQKLPFPSLVEGSGDTENNKKPIIDEVITPKPMSLPKNPVNEKKSTTASTVTISSASSIKQSSTPPPKKANQFPDDDDYNSLPELPKVKPAITTTTVAIPILQPEGSGADPDISQPKIVKPEYKQSTATTTKQPVIPDKQIEGSGPDTDPKSELERPRPVLPMVPEVPASSTPVYKSKTPTGNIDEELPLIEGSGKSSVNFPISSKPQTFTDSTLTPTNALLPDQYPGKIPPEVWIPGVEGVKNVEKDTEMTTPKSQVKSNYKSTIVIITSLSLLLICRLP